MALQRDTLELKPPKKFPIKNVSADLKTLFLKLSEAAVQGALIAPTAGGSLPEAVSAIFGAAEAVRLDHPPAELAWRLVRNGLTQALVELFHERQQSRPPYKGDLDHLKSRVEIQIGERDVSIGRNFFRNPTSMSILPVLKKTFASWLRLVKVAGKEAGSLANRLDSYFACALHDEWRAHREIHEPLHQYFETPFADALQMEADWDRNRFALMKQFEAPVFEETFSLRQIYVHLRGSYRQPITDKKLGHLADPEHEYRMIADDLDRLLQSWLDEPSDSRDSVRVISGGPGSGKSSYAKHLAARLSYDSGVRVLFIALQHFDMEEKLEDAIGTYLRRSGMFEPGFPG